jgi:hypothetical protein
VNERPQYYVLVGRTPIAVDLLTWAKSFEMLEKRIVAKDSVGNDSAEISTIFLGLDHNHFGGGPAILFESMIFGGPLDGERQRYATYAEAERGHAELVVRAKKAHAQISAMAKASGAKVT